MENLDVDVKPFLWNFISHVQKSDKLSGAEEKITESVSEESQKSVIDFL